MKWALMAYSTNTGLGYQTEGLAKHLKPDRIMVVDISSLNQVPTHHERFADHPDHWVTKGIPTMGDVERFLAGMDMIFVCETPLQWHIFERARQLGVKSILQFNYEFLDHLNQPTLPKPDLFVAPTTWHFDDVPYKNKRLLPVPVDMDHFKVRTKATRFLHTIGKLAHRDRNGTELFLQATQHVRRLRPDLKIEFVVSTQSDYDARKIRSNWPDIEVIREVEDRWSLYDHADVLVLPRRYGGLCLPALEALASGMPVLMPDCSPNADLLPKEWLMWALNDGSFVARAPIELKRVQPMDIALAMIRMATDTDFSGQSVRAMGIAEQSSWENLTPVYRETFEEVLRG